MRILERPRVHPVEVGEFVQLRAAHAQVVYEHVPLDALGAGRRQFRSDVRPVASISGQQAAGAHHICNLCGFTRSGQVIKQRSEQGVGKASVLVEAHCDNRHLAVVAAMHQVHFHVAELALHRVLAGMVEVELNQVVGDAVGHHGAAGVDARNDAAASVLERHGSGDVVEFERRQVLVQARSADIERRLLAPLAASMVGRVELVPHERPGVARVVPIRSVLCGADRGNAEEACRKERKAHKFLHEEIRRNRPEEF